MSPGGLGVKNSVHNTQIVTSARHLLRDFLVLGQCFTKRLSADLSYFPSRRCMYNAMPMQIAARAKTIHGAALAHSEIWAHPCALGSRQIVSFDMM